MTFRELEQRRRVLFTMLTVLTFRYPSGRKPALILALRAWLGGWPGIGRITVGMARHGFDLQLTRYDGEGWRATFFPEGRAHSLTAAVGSVWGRERWVAVQRAAWDVVNDGAPSRPSESSARRHPHPDRRRRTGYPGRAVGPVVRRHCHRGR